ncbi:phospholipase/Carboxylesterase [Rippkaea orientalis PCC 8801]|uniref:Phospholipase/Carboxylesterase n=1 Tax=Rippkaea orientalis (strain PCC 8801 / RF-1) TaxID=41431 RepID=B7JXZ6_RIPO1|nr:alpha/beta family hydrolase [Rippkaea orientalis]ACK65960.1 phospholipase/Carboxylesterase [Rippkaea orientalis PCC 8801]
MKSEVRSQKSEVREYEVFVDTGIVKVPAILSLPENASGIVVFVHGSGSSRHSPRNQYVAQELQQSGLATLLMDLLTPAEERIDLQTRHLRFDIPLLAQRVLGATQWLQDNSLTKTLKIGYFGASTGAAAALVAAAQCPDAVSAIVSRGGRPDLAEKALKQVLAPTLLIVGSRDSLVLELNQFALEQLQKTKHLAIIPKATHLFEEPGTLEAVARLASNWFRQYLSSVNSNQ